VVASAVRRGGSRTALPTPSRGTAPEGVVPMVNAVLTVGPSLDGARRSKKINNLIRQPTDQGAKTAKNNSLFHLRLRGFAPMREIVFSLHVLACWPQCNVRF
jgi:hypothetical protein